MNSNLRQSGAETHEVCWKDRDDCMGRVIDYEETRLEQHDAPADAVAMLGVFDPPKNNERVGCGVYLTAEQAVDTALMLLDSAARGRCEAAADEFGPWGCVADDDHERRWRLHVHACALSDHTFWVEKTENGWRAIEVETGVAGAEAATARDALHNYWERIY